MSVGEWDFLYNFIIALILLIEQMECSVTYVRKEYVLELNMEAILGLWAPKIF